MSLNRRHFLTSSAAFGGVAAYGHVDLLHGLESSAAENNAVTTFDETWQSYVDTGFYPPHTHLFFDDLYVDELNGVQRVVQTPQRASDDAVIKPEKPWEGIAFAGLRNSVIYDQRDTLFKFWYRCFDKMKYGGVSNSRWAYATSPDGLHWDRPELGLVEFEGSKNNNLVWIDSTLDVNALLMNVVLDERDPNPARRFKAIGMDAHPVQPWEIEVPYLRKSGFPTAGGLFAAYSPDGVRWTMRRGWLMGMICRDGSILHGYDEHINKWVLWQRPSFIRGKRIIGVSYSDDFERWTPPQMGLVNDEHDLPGQQFYELASATSPDRGYIGLVGCSGWQSQGLYAGESMPQLVFARDPRDWPRVSREPFMRHGPEGAFDEGVVMPMNPITVDDDVYLFYYAKNRGESWGEPTTDGQSVTTSSLGLAKMRRDRWVSLSPVGDVGTVTSSVICFANNELHVNVNAAGGSLRAELIDYDGKPVAGYTLDECVPITSDSMDQVVTWKDGHDLTELIGTAVHYPPEVSRAMRIKFALERAHLFSFSC